MHHFDIAHISQMGWNHRHPKRSVKNPANLDEVSCPALNLESDSITRAPSLMLWLLIGVGTWQTQDFVPPWASPGGRVKLRNLWNARLKNLRKTPIGRDGLSWKNNGVTLEICWTLGFFVAQKKKHQDLADPIRFISKFIDPEAWGTQCGALYCCHSCPFK